jgi:hypothetical protein
MNLVKCLLVMLLTLSSNCFAENWVLVHTDTKISALIDKDSIKKEGKFILARQMLDAHEFNSKLISTVLFNCKDRETSIKDTYLIKPDGSIDVWDKPKFQWAYVPKANNGNSMSVDYVCKK